jgi:hypothetical protein
LELPIRASDKIQRHQAIAIGYFASVAYRVLKAIVTLLSFDQCVETISIQREIMEASIKAEYYTIFAEKAHKLVASKHSHSYEFLLEGAKNAGDRKTVFHDDLEASRKKADEELQCFPEIMENGKLWSEPSLKQMIEEIGRFVAESATKEHARAIGKRFLRVEPANDAALQAAQKQMAKYRSWWINRFMSQALHSTSEVLDFAYDWGPPAKLIPFATTYRLYGDDQLLTAISAAIDVMTSVNIIIGKEDARAEILRTAFSDTKKIARLAVRGRVPRR